MSGDGSAGVAIRREGMAERETELAKRIGRPDAGDEGERARRGDGRSPRPGVRRPQEVLLPVPQLAGGQVPVCYFIGRNRPTPSPSSACGSGRGATSSSASAWRGRSGRCRSPGRRSSCCAAGRYPGPHAGRAVPQATACVQAEAEEVRSSPPTPGRRRQAGRVRREHPAARPGHEASRPAPVARRRRHPQERRERHLHGERQPGRGPDAGEGHRLPVGGGRSRRSGSGWRCTGSSSTSTAAGGSRSTRRRSHADIPAKPWQNIVMAKTTVAGRAGGDEAADGGDARCPYGQEIELLDVRG